MGIEGCAIIALVLVVLIGPLLLAIIAFTRASGLRQRLEELERSISLKNTRLGEIDVRVRKLESGRPPEPQAPAAPPAAPIPPPPPPKVEPVVVSPEALAKVFAPVPPPPPPPRPRPVPVVVPKEHVPLENLIGERILPRLGVTALVLGLGLLVWYSYGKLGPAGRLALAGAVGALMVAGGVVLRRLDRLLLLGGCLIGGGWAVMYITAYAAHFVAASRIVTSPLLGFLILLGVSAAALIHALRYRNEAIAGAAYLLTIVTLFLSPEPGPPAWLAMGLSGVTLVALAWRYRWIRLCTLGAALLYIAEATWLAQTPPADLVPAFAVLVSLWLMWIMPDYFHRPATGVTKAFHGGLVAINFAGLLVVGSLIQNWFTVRNMGVIWMTLGGLYAVHAVIGMKAAWRPAYLASLAAAAVLGAVGTHQHLEGIGPALAWIGIAAALFGWGLWRKDAFARVLGVAALVVAATRFWIVDRELDSAVIPALVLVVCSYGFSAVVAKLRRTGLGGETETQTIGPLAHMGAFALGLAIRQYPHELMVAGLLAISGVILLIVGRRLALRILVPEAIAFLTIAGLFMAMNNLDAIGAVAGISRKVASSIPVLLAWLYVREVFPEGEGDGKAVRGVFAVLLLAGLLALLRCELGAPATPAAWAVVAGAWFAWSKIERRDAEFLLAGAAAAVTVVALLVTTKLRVPAVGWIGPVATGSIMAGVFLGIHLFSRREAAGRAYSAARDVVAGAMAITAFTVLAREMTGTWLTGSWAVLGFALAGYGFVVRDRISRWSSLIVLAICVGKVVLFDLAEFDMPVKIATLLTLGAVMVALSYVYARHYRRIAVYLAGKE